MPRTITLAAVLALALASGPVGAQTSGTDQRAIAAPPASTAPAPAAAASAPPPAPTPAVTTAPTPAVATAPITSLRIATYGGAYLEAQRPTMLDPAAQSLGIGSEIILHGATIAPLAAGGLGWDVALLPGDIADKACSAGVIARIDPAMLDPAGAAAATVDFLPGVLGTCAVASMAWSAVAIVDDAGLAGKKPQRLADLFDVKRFPGKRAFPQGPRYLLELALLADGVAPAGVYGALATPEGIERAIRKLTPIRDSIVWWSRPEEPFELMRAGKAQMGIAFNGRAFLESMTGGRAYRTIWDGQIYALDVWTVAASARAPELARKFVAEVSRPDRMAAFARLLPYGPARQSALLLVGKHPIVGVEMAPFLPTERANFANALRFDSLWWESHEADLGKRLDAFRAGTAPAGGVTPKPAASGSGSAG